jgi:Ohr subfamily peroxiredoxin
MKTLFTAKASTTGGRNGHSHTADNKLSFELAMPGAPTKKSGPVTNPEELFACGYSACFGSALEYVAGQQKITVTDVTVNADVSLNSDDNGFFLSVILDVSIPGLDDATTQKLVSAAHKVCPYSKATRGNIQVTLKANQQPLNQAA